MVTVPSSCPTVPLSNGRNIPILGLGTSHVGGYSHEAVHCALQECGIRHIDTAKRYGCEEALGKAVVDSGVPREELWLTTKLWPGDYGYQSTKQACRDSCARLGVDYLDLYLMHWPDCMVPGVSSREVRSETWRALEELYDEGSCSFRVYINENLSLCLIYLQVEFHPFQQPLELVEYCRKENIVFEGYCPLAKGQALTHPSVMELAQKYGRSTSQICIRWSIQHGVVTIPKSTKPERVHENCQVFGFTLSAEDMDRIRGLHTNQKLIHLTYPIWKG
uniref:Uncharacterized oxidoreductase ZK1290.5-like n=1 Tax=Sinocyclocheilus grahami TaxID=75366 RepID=A0A672KNW1_SINGR